jgi:preprotein translocase subunit SecE
MGQNKVVHLMFAIGALLAAFLLSRTGDWVWSYFAKPQDLVLSGGALLIAGGAALVAYRNERMFSAAVEVTRELEKVTWPTRKETSAATVVVIVTVTIASLILTVFDFIWSRLADLLLR